MTLLSMTHELPVVSLPLVGRDQGWGAVRRSNPTVLH